MDNALIRYHTKPGRTHSAEKASFHLSFIKAEQKRIQKYGIYSVVCFSLFFASSPAFELLLIYIFASIAAKIMELELKPILWLIYSGSKWVRFLWVLFVTTSVISYLANPAASQILRPVSPVVNTPTLAVFFEKAQEFFECAFSNDGAAGTNQAIALVFNVLRALYLLYIAVSLIGVVNAVRKDEDWQVVARTPLLVVVAVTIADVLTAFIVGDTCQTGV